MFLAYVLSWWYGNGLVGRFKIIKNRLQVTVDFFSISLLIRTLFAPYKQISAEQVDGSIDVKIRAFFDKLLSRIIGAVIRLFMVIFGLVALAVQTIISGIILIIWLVLPLVPIAGLIIWVIGWVPQWTI